MHCSVDWVRKCFCAAPVFGGYTQGQPLARILTSLLFATLTPFREPSCCCQFVYRTVLQSFPTTWEWSVGELSMPFRTDKTSGAPLFTPNKADYKKRELEYFGDGNQVLFLKHSFRYMVASMKYVTCAFGGVTVYEWV